MAMTVMSQRECLRKIVIINFASRNVPQLSRPPNAFWRFAAGHPERKSMDPVAKSLTYDRGISRSVTDGSLFSRWRGERSRSFLNQFPCITQMLFRGDN